LQDTGERTPNPPTIAQMTRRILGGGDRRGFWAKKVYQIAWALPGGGEYPAPRQQFPAQKYARCSKPLAQHTQDNRPQTAHVQIGIGNDLLRPRGVDQTRRAQLGLLQAEVGYQVAVAGVDHATGGLLESYHVKIGELTR